MGNTGALGEEIAARFLERAGYRILARNWRAGRLELDLVARDGETIAFVEVKTRRPGPQSPSEAVGRRKRARLRTAAARWIATRRDRARDYRFDVVAVTLGPGRRATVRHDVGAFTGDDC
ncbi:MAG: YraN family protein [Gemmatimonadota bacterium]